MPYPFPPDVARLVRERLATGQYTSEDDVLRDALHALGAFTHSSAAIDQEYQETVAAVREGLADAEAGRMRPLRELIEEEGSKQSGSTGSA